MQDVAELIQHTIKYSFYSYAIFIGKDHGTKQEYRLLLCRGLLLPVVITPVHIQGTFSLALLVAQLTMKHFPLVLVDVSDVDI
jgi:hypothetical protein